MGRNSTTDAKSGAIQKLLLAWKRRDRNVDPIRDRRDLAEIRDGLGCRGAREDLAADTPGAPLDSIELVGGRWVPRKALSAAEYAFLYNGGVGLIYGDAEAAEHEAGEPAGGGRDA